jgi:hypothetical protein
MTPLRRKTGYRSSVPECATSIADIGEVVGEDLVEEPLARHPDLAAEPVDLVERSFVDEPRASYVSSHAVSFTQPALAGAASRK